MNAAVSMPPRETPGAPVDAPPRRLKWLGPAAVVAALALATALGVRPMSSYDIGYHLAYGEHFLDTGRIVQTNQFIYTHLRKDILADPKNLGPGCWYDQPADAYHFVNANWLSQVIFAGLHRAGGMGALCALQAGLIAAIFLVLIVALRRAKVPWHWVAAGVILTALASYERFDLRPEVLGYLVLVGQWALLMEERFTWPKVGGVILLQLLAVNVHSYFLLGTVLALVMLASAVARWVWARAVTGADASLPARRAKWLAAAAGGTVLAALCNPWFARGALMPIQTVWFLQAHNISGSNLGEGGTFHPWALITEFGAPLTKEQAGMLVTHAYLVVLVLGAAGALAALAIRRWGWAAVLVVMGAASLQMRRNIAPSAMVMVPLGMIALTRFWRAVLEFRAARKGRTDPGTPRRQFGAKPTRGNTWAWTARRLATPAIAGALLLLGLVLLHLVVSQELYFDQRQNWRFGTGASEMILAQGPARWLTDNAPAGNVFTDYETSSNLMYFTGPRGGQPHWPMPVLTNTWAYPPYVMQWVIQITAGQRQFEPARKEYDISTVVLHSSLATAPLIKALAKDPDWAIVHVGCKQVIFLRRDQLGGRSELSQQRFDTKDYIARVSAADPVAAYALHNAAALLEQMGWYDAAIVLWQRCVELRPDYHEALANLGTTLAKRGTNRLLEMQKFFEEGKDEQANRARQDGLEDWKQAQRQLERAIGVKPDFEHAKEDLQLLQRQMADFARGIIAVPKEN